MMQNNTSSPLVSVIIPNFNNSQYIAECLESVLTQTYQDLEIICIDDASTDNSVDIIKRFMVEYQNIRLIENETNIGVTANRDKAILVSRGEYFTTLDGDDFFLSKHKIEKELSKIQSFGEGADNIIAFSDIRLVDKHGKELKPGTENNIKEGDIFKEIFLRQCLIPRDYLMQKKLYLEVNGFDKKIPLYEDWDLKIRLAKKNYFVYSGVPGIAYRRHGTGLSSTDKRKHVDWLCYIYRKNSNLIPRDDVLEYQSAFLSFLEHSFGTKSLLQRLSQSPFQKIIQKIRAAF